METPRYMTKAMRNRLPKILNRTRHLQCGTELNEDDIKVVKFF